MFHCSVCHRQYCVKCTWMYRTRVHFIFCAGSHVAVNRFFVPLKTDSNVMLWKSNMSWAWLGLFYLCCSKLLLEIFSCSSFLSNCTVHFDVSSKSAHDVDSVQSMLKLLYIVLKIWLATQRFMSPSGFFWSLLKTDIIILLPASHTENIICFHLHIQY